MNYESASAEPRDFNTLDIVSIHSWTESVKNIIGKEIEGEVFAAEAIPARDELVKAIDSYYEIAGTKSVNDTELETALQDVRTKAETLQEMIPDLDAQIQELTRKMQQRTGLDGAK